MKVCKYLGMQADPHTAAAFPSSRNTCYRGKRSEAINLQHQQVYCLSENHRACPLYLRASPSGLRPLVTIEGEKLAARPYIRVAVFLLAFGGVTVIAWFVFQARVLPASSASLASPAGAVGSLIVRATASPVNTLLPTRSPTPIPSQTSVPASQTSLPPTATKTIQPTPSQTRVLPSPPARAYVLETPRATVPQLIIHRVQSGENYEALEKRYRTSAEAIRGINYSLPGGLLVGTLVVIPLNTTNVDGLPFFEAYQVSRVSMTLAGLANEIKVNLSLMEKFNLMHGSDILPIDTWLLVPHLLPKK